MTIYYYLDKVFWDGRARQRHQYFTKTTSAPDKNLVTYNAFISMLNIVFKLLILCLLFIDHSTLIHPRKRNYFFNIKLNNYSIYKKKHFPIDGYWHRYWLTEIFLYLNKQSKKNYKNNNIHYYFIKEPILFFRSF